MNRTRYPYSRPKLVSYGSLLDHTFTTPGGHVKTCTARCNIDNFGETAGRPDFVDQANSPAS